MSHPDGLPDLFLDRSLGRIKVPQLLRAAGLRLTTLAEHYGIPADEGISDATWLTLAGTKGWVVFMKDTRIRYNSAEREAVRQHRVRCFCLSNQHLSASDMATFFLNNLDRVVEACREPGPFVYAVHRHRIDPLALRTVDR